MRVLGLLVIAACQAHDPALQQRIDALSAQVAATQRDVAAIREVLRQPPAPPPGLDEKLDALDKKLDKLAQSQAARPLRARPDKDKVYAVKVDGYAAEGPASARVTMVMAFDYACPYCDRNRATRADLRKKYGNDLRIVYRNFVVHPQIATAMALGGCAATKQQAFFAYDAIAAEKGFRAHNFDKDKCWEAAGGCPIVESFAREAKLDMTRFVRDMRGRCVDEVRDDGDDLKRFGVAATPTFYINGRFFEGAAPLEDFEALIDHELAKASERITAGAKAATYYDEFVIRQGVPGFTP